MRARLLPALLLVAACRATTPAPSTPTAAPSPATLESVDPVRAAFNDATDRRRLLALFSPS